MALLVDGSVWRDSDQMGSNSASAPAQCRLHFEAASSSADVASNELVRLTAGECGAEVPARPVRFRRHARRLGWGSGDHVLRQGTGMSTEERKALVHRLVAEVFNEGRLEALDELYEPSRGLPSPGVDCAVSCLVQRS